MSAPDNPPAFPVRIESPLGAIDIKPGMTLRDYFAGQALAGYAANQRALAALAELAGKRAEPIHELVAMAVYGLADAMLAERLKP